MSIAQLIAVMGIPSAITGLLVWWFKRTIDKRDKKRDEREKNTEKLMLLIMQTSRATNILAEATAKAVQRIPDAHCNGDMTAALEQAAKIQKEEKDFIMDQGIKHIFED
jgi:hypothetical protein